jgi:hypothetical protein
MKTFMKVAITQEDALFRSALGLRSGGDLGRRDRPRP